MDSAWDDNPDDTTFRDVEWSRISTEFTNVGYREGITAGKEASSQEGFDVGYATVGVPIGRNLGLLRGMTFVLLAFLKDSVDIPERSQMIAEAQDISFQLSRIRFSDIMPRDIEAEDHAREHLEAKGEELDPNEEIAARRDMEGIEDMLANLSSGNGKTKNGSSRPTIEDLQTLKSRLNLLSGRLELDVNFS
ncbi:hypothetical protein GALMADRAFT_1311677 [Galerina marginata CBS 339.88]|uniref:Protein YAE1 n=1 Tax=Galerina marginata (strain CBS 339.88) TaxID=685588 RepID=A0A067T578_GALM3|nr:hypothetical protein GALMADRAFT_1311677 [Galerina marginata CBS 339.88]